MADQTNNLLIIPLTDDSAAGGQIGVPRTIKESTDTVKLGAPLELTNAVAPLKVAGPLQSAAGTDLKLVGDDNIELKLGDDAGVAQFKVLDSQGVAKAYIDSDGHAQFDGSLTVDTTAHFGGDVSIDGDLDVTGSIVARSQIDVLIHDSYLDLGFGNTTTAVQPGGFTVQMNRTPGFIAGKVTDFPSTTSFVYAQNDAANASLLVAGMVIAITGLPAEHAEDEGLFVVASVSGAAFPQTVTIESTPMVNLPWAQTLLTVGTPATAGSAYQTALAVVSVADGSNFKDAEGQAPSVGSLVTGYVSASTKAAWQADGAYVGVGAGSTTMQDTYENGNTITTDANGNVVIGGSEALEVTAAGGILTNTLSASGDISGANLTLSGDISADDAVFSGDVSGATAHITGAIEAGSANLSGALDAASATLTGNLQAVDGVFSGNVSGVDGIFSGDLSGADAVLSGDLSAVDASLSGYLAAVGATFSADVSGVNIVLSGDLSANDGTFSGDISGVNATLSGDLGANDATLSGSLSAVNGTFSGDISGVNATLTGDLNANDAVLSGDLDAVNGSFSADIDAVNAVLTGDLSAVNITITGDISGNDATFSGDLSAAFGEFTNGLTVSGAALTVQHSFDADLLGSFTVDGDHTVSFGAVTPVDSFSVDADSAVSLAGAAASDFTVAADLTLETTAAGVTYVKSAVEVEVSAPLFDVNSSGAIQLDANDDAHFIATGHSLSLQTVTSGELDITAAGLLDINANADLDLDVSGAAYIDATGSVSIDAGAASNLTAQGDLSVQAQGAGSDLLLQAADKIDADAATVEIDATGAISLGAAAASDFTVAGNLTLETSGAGITDLKSAVEVQVSTALFDVNASGAAQIDAAANSWFKVAGAQLELATVGSGELDLTSAGLMDVNAGASLDVDVVGSFTMDSTGAFSIDGVGASNLSTAGALAIEASAGAMDLDASGALSINSSAAAINIGNDAVNQAINLGTAGNRTLSVGHTANTSALNLQGGSGGVALTVGSSAGTVAIANDTGTGAVNIVGAGATAARSVNLATGGTAAKTLTMGSTASTSATTMQTGTGAMTFSAGGIFDVNSTGAVTIDSSGGTIGIGTDNVNQNVNIGTSGNRQIQIGHTNNTSGLDLRGGSGGIAFDSAATITQNSFSNTSRGLGFFFANVSGVSIPSGAIVAYKYNASDSVLPQLTLAVANAAQSVERMFVGVSENSSVAAGANGKCSNVPGLLTRVLLTTTPVSTDVGQPIYISTTAGYGSLTPPTASGSTIYRIGFLSRIGGGSPYRMIIAPQFIGTVP